MHSYWLCFIHLQSLCLAFFPYSSPVCLIHQQSPCSYFPPLQYLWFSCFKLLTVLRPLTVSVFLFVTVLIVVYLPTLFYSVSVYLRLCTPPNCPSFTFIFLSLTVLMIALLRSPDSLSLRLPFFLLKSSKTVLIILLLPYSWVWCLEVRLSAESRACLPSIAMWPPTGLGSLPTFNHSRRIVLQQVMRGRPSFDLTSKTPWWAKKHKMRCRYWGYWYDNNILGIIKAFLLVEVK